MSSERDRMTKVKKLGTSGSFPSMTIAKLR